MSYKSNAWLEKYEIKKPDYEIFERSHDENMHSSCLRYDKVENGWVLNKSVSESEYGRLMFVGDITCLEKQFQEAAIGESYDFNYAFEKIKDVFSQADLVVGNLETMIFPEAPYRTEKYVSEQNFHCNAPIEFLTALYDAGVDMLTTANNHDLDTGAVGIGATIDNIENSGFIQTGTFKSDKKRYEILDINSIRIAITAFATNHNNKECNLTAEGIEFMLNDYSPERAKRILNEARSDGADLVFVCMHWGSENVTTQNKKQKKIAKEIAEMGYDCIIGSHPHVLQPFTYIKTKSSMVPVFYSLGNFISHNTKNVKSRSAIACIEIKKTSDKVELSCSYIPIYTSEDFGNKKYVVLPLKADLIDLRNIRKINHIKKVLGEDIPICSGVDVQVYRERPNKLGKKKKVETLNFNKVKRFPVDYDDGDFKYIVEKEGLVVKGLSPQYDEVSCTVPEDVEGVPVIGLIEGAFLNNDKIKKINFRKNLRYIGNRVCKGCTSLEGFQISTKTEEIKTEAFADCTSLTAVVMRKGISSIGNRAFAGCVDLKTVKIPSNVEHIAEDAFEGCENAVFYCEKGSYAETYAVGHGFKVVNMAIY